MLIANSVLSVYGEGLCLIPQSLAVPQVFLSQGNWPLFHAQLDVKLRHFLLNCLVSCINHIKRSLMAITSILHQIPRTLLSSKVFPRAS